MRVSPQPLSNQSIGTTPPNRRRRTREPEHHEYQRPDHEAGGVSCTLPVCRWVTALPRLIGCGRETVVGEIDPSLVDPAVDDASPARQWRTRPR